MANVSINMLYNEIKLVRKKLEKIENIILPEEMLSNAELAELDKLRTEALEEYKKKQTINVVDL